MAAPDSELKIVVGGRKFGGWQDVRVSRGVERASSDFDIRCTQHWPGQDERFEIADGDACEIWIGDDKVLTGYVEKNRVRRDANTASCTIAGRSKTCDLVDCTPDFDMVEFSGQTIAQVARRLAAPFKIDVVARDGGPPVDVAAAHHGESPWKAIERLARQQQLLVMDDPEGRLVLARLAETPSDDSLVHPSDGLKSIETERDASHRFSDYSVKAQAGGGWVSTNRDDDEPTAEAIAHVQSSVVHDRGVRRYRPRTLLAEGPAKKAGTDARAEWECRRNIGKALKVNAVRVKWRQSSGKLWLPNLLVPVEIPAANVNARLALSEVSYRKNDADGEVCDLLLVPPEALTPEPPEAPAAGGGNRWTGSVNVHDA